MKAILLPKTVTEESPVEVAKFLVAEAAEQLKADTSEKPEIVTAIQRLEEAVYWIGRTYDATSEDVSVTDEAVQTTETGANPGTQTVAAGRQR